MQDLIHGCVWYVSDKHVAVLATNSCIYYYDFETHKGKRGNWREGNSVVVMFAMASDEFKIKEVIALFPPEHFEEKKSDVQP